MATAKGNVVGVGHTATTQNVLRTVFSRPLSSKVKYECYDGGTFPATSSVTTTANAVFGLGGGAENSMIGLHDLTFGAEGATSWFPSTSRANSGSMNIMKGQTYFVTQQGATLETAGASLHYDIQLKIPASTSTSDTMAFDLLFRYTYTSTTPTVTYMFNDEANSGTPAVPVWATIQLPGVFDVRGLRHSRTGYTTSDTTFLANIPETGQEKTTDVWVTD